MVRTAAGKNEENHPRRRDATRRRRPGVVDGVNFFRGKPGRGPRGARGTASRRGPRVSGWNIPRLRVGFAARPPLRVRGALFKTPSASAWRYSDDNRRGNKHSSSLFAPLPRSPRMIRFL
ncbi:hypothetical protein ZWY2020_053600 [Hordeum vulgare]|nr:hypothetical protein ZWY2020_053600 [Hordeum vulgare]